MNASGLGVNASWSEPVGIPYNHFKPLLTQVEAAAHGFGGCPSTDSVGSMLDGPYGQFWLFTILHTAKLSLSFVTHFLRGHRAAILAARIAF